MVIMTDLDTLALRTFVVADAEGSFSAAAAVLGCSQGAVSMRIKRLEESLGGALFTRNYHQLTLTDLGRTVLVDAKRLLAMQTMLLANSRPSRDLVRIRLGVAEDYAEPILSRLVSSLMTRHPQLKLDVTCGLSVLLKTLVAQDDLDLAIVTTASPATGSELLSKQKLLWVTSGSSILAPQDAVPLAVFPEGCAFRERVIERLDRIGRDWRVVFSSSSGEAIRSAVSAGVAVTVMADNTIPQSLTPAPGEWRLPELGHAEVRLVRGANVSAEIDTVSRELARIYA